MPKDQSLKEYLDGNELDLSLHNLTVVPVKELAAIPKAIKLDLSCNQLTGLPESFCSSLTHVVKIDLSKNSLSVLPENFGDLINLQHLDLLGNKLTKLPVSFCELQKLKWLDLKDNPLNNELKKVAGNCLDEKECRQCAQNILQHMKNIEAELQRKRQKKEEVKKKHELARKQKEEQEKEKKKKEKQEEKARKRQEYEAMKAAKKATSKETKTKKVEEEASLLNGYTAERGPVKSGKSSYKSFFYWFIFLVCLLLAIFIGVKYFCEDAGKTDAYCKTYWPQVKNATDPYIKKYWRPAEDFVWKMYDTLSIQMKEIIKNLTTTKNDSVSKDSGTVK